MTSYIVPHIVDGQVTIISQAAQEAKKSIITLETSASSPSFYGVLPELIWPSRALGGFCGVSAFGDAKGAFPGDFAGVRLYQRVKAGKIGLRYLNA